MTQHSLIVTCPIVLPELSLLISSHLTLSDLAHCVLVCKAWRNSFGVEFAVRLAAAWRQLDTTPCSESLTAKRAFQLKQRGIHSEEQLWRLEPLEEPMSPRYRVCAATHDPLPQELVRDFRRFGHLIRKLKVNRAWPFSDPGSFCPGLERLHIDVERVEPPRTKKKAYRRYSGVDDEDQYQHLVDQAMVCIAQAHSLQYLYLRVHMHSEVRAVIRWHPPPQSHYYPPFFDDDHDPSPPSSPPPQPFLPVLSAADICGPVDPTFVDTLLRACPRLRRLSLLGNHPSLHLSYQIAVCSTSLEELTISVRQHTWHALHWATRLPNLRQLTVLLKPFAGASRLPTFHRLTSLSIQEIEPEEGYAHDGIARLLKAIPVGNLKHLSLQIQEFRRGDFDLILPHASASLVSFSLQASSSFNHTTSTITSISLLPISLLEQGAHLQSLKVSCPMDATDGLVQPWACADTLEELEVVFVYSREKRLMRRVLERIATCTRLRRLWTTATTSTVAGHHNPYETAVLNISQVGGLVDALAPLTRLESLSLYHYYGNQEGGSEEVQDEKKDSRKKLNEADAEWMAAHFPALKEIVGLQQASSTHAFRKRMRQIRPEFSFGYW